MPNLFDSIRSPYRSLDPSSLLVQSTSILLGVSESAANALEDVGIATVFDLATSVIFANAVDICLLAESGQGRFAATGKVPCDTLRRGHDKPLTELPLQPISILNTNSPIAKMNALAVAIDIASVRDLAAWPPYRTAREILDRVYNPLPTCDALDQEAPADLVPANGQYPTERVQYEVLLFDKFVGGREGGIAPRRLGADGALDISELLSDDGGYERPAVGGILTYTQFWYTKGLSLGQLIHGVALAPGESTKIAMIDWSRTVKTSATETIQEVEQLVSDLSRARAISEITRAVANETQRGDSAAHSAATATQSGESGGYAGFRDLPADFGPGDIVSPGVTTSGTSFGSSAGSTDATSWSTSSGERNIDASLAQDIVDRTHQAAHSARNRRASIVREVSQKESESISTRTLTNYNHMHALTVEYYEVVQLYRTVVELSKADRCLFVPMKVIDFTQPRVVDRYRQVIAANGLGGDVRALLMTEPERIALWAPLRVGPWDTAKLERANRLYGIKVGAATDAVLGFPKSFSIKDIFFDPETPFSSLIATLVSGETVTLALAAETGGPGDAGGPLFGTLHTTGGVYKDGYLFDHPLYEVRRVEAVKKNDNADFSGKVTVNAFDWSDDPRIDGPVYALSWTIEVSATSTRVTLFELQPTVTTKELVEHLQANRLYYSQVIWRALDPATIGILVSGYTWPAGGQDKPLVELVDPRPVAIVANYLVFRISGDDAAEHAAWLDKKNIIVGSRREDLVPVPSGGVFAEAVLGRFNSAEKLDITRFWNWQDSPIPTQAPDIAPIQAGSRRDPDNTTPGQLDTPVLNIVNAPSLPDPQGMGAVLAAIQNGNMFRDMSGLAATVGLAQAGLAGAQQGATDASAQAGQNAAVAAQLGAKVAELAAKVVSAYLSGGAGLAAGAGAGGLAGLAGGISGQGAKINHGKDMDSRGVRKSEPGTTVPSNSNDLGKNPGQGDEPIPDGYPYSTQANAAPLGTWEGDATNMAMGGAQGNTLGMSAATTWPAGDALQNVGWPSSDSYHGGPKKLLSGVEAETQAAKLLANAPAIVKLPDGGELKPGTIWSGNSILLSADWTYAYYFREGDLYEWGTQQFIRNEMLAAWQKGVQSAEGWIVLANLEIALLAGIFAAPEAIIGATIVDSGLKLYHYRKEAEVAYRVGWKVLAALQCVRENAPEAWNKLLKITAWQIFTHIPQGVSGKQVAFWIGRVVRETFKAAPEISLAIVAKAILKISAILSAIDGLVISGHALESAIDEKAQELSVLLSQEGAALSEEDCKELLRELYGNGQAIQCLEQLRISSAELRPLLDELAPQLLGI